MARPSDYKPEFNEQAKRFALLGYTAKEIAKAFDIAESTFHKWKKEFPEFSEAVTRGRDVADAEVAEAFFKRATGFTKSEQKAFVVSQGDFTQRVEVIDVDVHYPPDAGAALNWLKNRQPGKWRDKQDVQLSGEVSVTLNLDGETKPADEQP